MAFGTWGLFCSNWISCSGVIIISLITKLLLFFNGGPKTHQRDAIIGKNLFNRCTDFRYGLQFHQNFYELVFQWTLDKWIINHISIYLLYWKYQSAEHWLMSSLTTFMSLGCAICLLRHIEDCILSTVSIGLFESLLKCFIFVSIVRTEDSSVATISWARFSIIIVLTPSIIIINCTFKLLFLSNGSIKFSQMFY